MFYEKKFLKASIMGLMMALVNTSAQATAVENEKLLKIQWEAENFYNALDVEVWSSYEFEASGAVVLADVKQLNLGYYILTCKLLNADGHHCTIRSPLFSKMSNDQLSKKVFAMNLTGTSAVSLYNALDKSKIHPDVEVRVEDISDSQIVGVKQHYQEGGDASNFNLVCVKRNPESKSSCTFEYYDDET